MHILPKSDDGRRKCATKGQIAHLTLSNIDRCAQRAHLIQVKLRVSMWTKLPIYLKDASFGDT